MKLTSLTTMTISGAVMAGVAIASNGLLITPQNLPCSPSNQAGCSTGITGWNSDNDFRYYCGSSGTITSYTACDCKNCCIDADNGQDVFC
ncbi:hypothetical protein DEU56DRAFT_831507 [Suillus clintonianus]|uniref:uncharacterized protein n=1 Tax=Suillus clintonianus TaxID=1904413 RepID=UPI001B868A05|nr:uncharacterized protein DEU56DRAFT_831507 [Suillus clintonianus]KAG2122735.1 hypothetical protein DEU56DRAFT_831507 [Suillus clintonianus]